VLTDDERRGLDRLVRARSTPQQLVQRARIILLCAEGKNNSQIARELDINPVTPRLWRERWRGLGAVTLDDLSVEQRLTDVPRPGRPAQITADQTCRIIALACEAPSQSGRPISKWTGREIADEIVKRGILPTISPRHAARLLKRGIFSRTASAIG
jgi:transposase